MQAHCVVIDLLDRSLGHALAHLGVAVLVLLAGVVFLHHRREKPEIGGTGRRVQPAGEIEHHVVRVEVVAVAPLHALAQLEGPGLEVVGGFPAFRQVGPGDVIRTGDGQVLDDMAGLVGLLGPVEGGRIDHLLHLHRNPQGAAFLRGLGRGFLHQAAAGRIAGKGIGRSRRDAEESRQAHELAPVHLAVLVLLAQLLHAGVQRLPVDGFQFFVVLHDCRSPCELIFGRTAAPRCQGHDPFLRLSTPAHQTAVLCRRGENFSFSRASARNASLELRNLRGAIRIAP